MTHSPLDGATISTRLEDLARHSDEPDRLTRLTLSPAHRAAAQTVLIWMREVGMEARLDAIGNVVGRYEGATADAKTLLIGSHIDTVRNAGRYDGNLGVVTGIAVVAELARRSARLPFAVEVIAFGDEEGARFSTTLSGSRAVAGRFDPACLAERDSAGVARGDELAAMGCDAAAIGALARDPANILGYVEVHIEQGPVLEAQNLPVGIVTAINGVSRGEVVVKGVAGHAGTLPMAMRHDALSAAAEMILAVEARGRAEEGLVATVGLVETRAGAVNVVQGETRFTLDVRSASDEARLRAVADIKARIAEIAAARGVAAAIDMRYDAPAAPCDVDFMHALERSAAGAGVAPFRLPSGAGHDAMAFRGLWPIAMLFVRCRSGISHNPAEYATPEDMGLAARILFDFLYDFGAHP
jgi:allantoate deiminase